VRQEARFPGGRGGQQDRGRLRTHLDNELPGVVARLGIGDAVEAHRKRRPAGMRDAGYGCRELRRDHSTVGKADDVREEIAAGGAHHEAPTHPPSRIPHPGRAVTDLQPDGVRRFDAPWAVDASHERVEKRGARQHDDAGAAQQIGGQRRPIDDSPIADHHDRTAARRRSFEPRTETRGPVGRRRGVERSDAITEPPDCSATRDRARGIEGRTPQRSSSDHAERRVEEHQRPVPAGKGARGNRVPEE